MSRSCYPAQQSIILQAIVHVHYLRLTVHQSRSSRSLESFAVDGTSISPSSRNLPSRDVTSTHRDFGKLQRNTVIDQSSRLGYEIQALALAPQVDNAVLSEVARRQEGQMSCSACTPPKFG